MLWMLVAWIWGVRAALHLAERMAATDRAPPGRLDLSRAPAPYRQAGCRIAGRGLTARVLGSSLRKLGGSPEGLGGGHGSIQAPHHGQVGGVPGAQLRLQGVLPHRTVRSACQGITWMLWTPTQYGPMQQSGNVRKPLREQSRRGKPAA